MVRDFLLERDGGFNWVWGWRRRLFVWEDSILNNLLEVLPVVVLSEEEDVWSWELEDNGCFSVRSAYLLLDAIFSPASLLDDLHIRVLKNIWKSPAPFKVIAFSWKLIRNRLPTTDNLLRRGVHVDGDSTVCVHCGSREENVTHLFLCCDFALGVWLAIFRWLGLVLILPPNLAMLFDCFVEAAVSKKKRLSYYLIWHATVWRIWRSRNNIIFSDGVIELEKVVDEIKLLSWRWGLSRHKIPVCLFYEWCWDSGLCLH
jgi:hypothetical protein